MKASIEKVARPAATPTPKRDTTQYDQLTLALEQANGLAYHLVDRLASMADGLNEAWDTEIRELYALSVIAQAIADKHQLIREKASALLKAGR